MRATTSPVVVMAAIVAFAGSVAAAFLVSTKAIGIAIAVTLAMTLVLFACLFVMRGDDRYRVVRHSGDIDFDAMASMLGAGSFLHHAEMTSPGTSEMRLAGYVSNPTVDRLFITNPYYVEVVGIYERPHMMRPYESCLRTDIYEDEDVLRDPQGGEILGLAGDLTTTMLATGRSIPVTRVTADDMAMTDGAFDRVVATTGLHGTVLFDGCSMSMADGGFLLPTSQSGNANAIMAHSVIITSDGYLALMEDEPRCGAQEGRIVPTVSCLVHMEDIEQSVSFQDAIVLAVHKAARAAYSIAPEIPIGSSVLGLARIIERNGATEFYAITRVGATMGQLVAGQAFGGIRPAMQLTQNLLAGVTDENEIADRLSRIAYMLRDTTSISLSVSMAALASALFEAMGNPKTKNRVMHRLGYASGPGAVGNDTTNNLMDIAANVAEAASEQQAADPGGTSGLSGTMAMMQRLRLENKGGGKDDSHV